MQNTLKQIIITFFAVLHKADRANRFCTALLTATIAGTIMTAPCNPFNATHVQAAPPELIDAAGNTYTIWSEMTDYLDYGPTIYHSENTNALFNLDYEPVNGIAYVGPFSPNLSIYSALSNEEVTILEGYLHENYPEIRLQRKEEPTTYGEIELELIYDQDLTIEEQLMIAQDIKANTGLITAALSTTEAYTLYVPYISGDLNNNGTVDTVDAIIALQEYNTVSVMGGDSALTFNQFRAADLDGDGSITAMDAQEILKTYNTNMQ